MQSQKQQKEIVLAFMDGKAVEYRRHGSDTWTNKVGGTVAFVPAFDFATFEYRIKREPRVFYVNKYPDSACLYHHSTKEAAEQARAGAEGETIKLVEVIEE